MRFDKCDVAGSVTMYNSEIQVIENILSYLGQIDHLFIIDNSEVPNYELVEQVKKLSNITYVSNSANLGVAYALNQAANMAIRAGYQFLLTMDDDTSLPDGAIQRMLTYANACGLKKIGIIGGQWDPRSFNDTIKLVPYTLTSGNLLNLSAYKECGPFMNELFIDFVDLEYCFRLTEKKYEIKEINNIHLIHNLGEKKQLKLLGYKFPLIWVSHSPLRVYYKTRNCLFVLKKYSFIAISLKIFFYNEVFKDFIKILLLEDRKNYRIAFFFRAITDAIQGNMGKKRS